MSPEMRPEMRPEMSSDREVLAGQGGSLLDDLDALTLGQYFLHDLAHHLVDVRA
jgi:hypothetical protein